MPGPSQAGAQIPSWVPGGDRKMNNIDTANRLSLKTLRVALLVAFSIALMLAATASMTVLTAQWADAAKGAPSSSPALPEATGPGQLHAGKLGHKLGPLATPTCTAPSWTSVATPQHNGESSFTGVAAISRNDIWAVGSASSGN